MGTSTFKIKTVTEGQDFLVHDLGGVFVEKFVKVRSTKVGSQTQTIPNGQSATFQLFDLDIKDAKAIGILIHSPQNLSGAEASLTVSTYTSDGVPLMGMPPSSVNIVWHQPINPGRTPQSFGVMELPLSSSLCGFADVVVTVPNTSGSEAEITVEVFAIFEPVFDPTPVPATSMVLGG
jgi:hypothetical protein